CDFGGVGWPTVPSPIFCSMLSSRRSVLSSWHVFTTVSTRMPRSASTPIVERTSSFTGLGRAQDLLELCREPDVRDLELPHHRHLNGETGVVEDLLPRFLVRL